MRVTLPGDGYLARLRHQVSNMPAPRVRGHLTCRIMFTKSCS